MAVTAKTENFSQDRQALRCKFCSATEIVRHGRTSANKQRYQCRECGRTFVDNGAPPGMRFQAEVIASTLNMFYEGASLGRIKRHVQLEYGVQPDHASIHRWIMRYTKMSVAGIGQPALVAGDEWVALSSTIFTYFAKGQTTRNLDVVDLASGFLLGTHMDFGPSAGDEAGVIAAAARTALRWPKTVLTNSLEFLPLQRGWNSPVYPMNGFDPSC
ncbi:MAG: IS1 family transposase, partial [Chloroflexi bacterium]|nr:IS1 family transposase [Chloroflexota bacterium]